MSLHELYHNHPVMDLRIKTKVPGEHTINVPKLQYEVKGELRNITFTSKVQLGQYYSKILKKAGQKAKASEGFPALYAKVSRIDTTAISPEQFDSIKSLIKLQKQDIARPMPRKAKVAKPSKAEAKPVNVKVAKPGKDKSNYSEKKLKSEMYRAYLRKYTNLCKKLSPVIVALEDGIVKLNIKEYTLENLTTTITELVEDIQQYRDDTVAEGKRIIKNKKLSGTKLSIKGKEITLRKSYVSVEIAVQLILGDRQPVQAEEAEASEELPTESEAELQKCYADVLKKVEEDTEDGVSTEKSIANIMYTSSKLDEFEKITSVSKQMLDNDPQQVDSKMTKLKYSQIESLRGNFNDTYYDQNGERNLEVKKEMFPEKLSLDEIRNARSYFEEKVKVKHFPKFNVGHNVYNVKDEFSLH